MHTNHDKLIMPCGYFDDALEPVLSRKFVCGGGKSSPEPYCRTDNSLMDHHKNYEFGLVVGFRPVWVRRSG